MLSRRMLRIKAFKVLYASSMGANLPLKESLAMLDDTCEAVRDLSVYLLSIIVPLTEEARRRIESARGKFNPTEEDLHPNLRFAENRTASILAEDPDFQKFLQRKKLSWQEDDVLIRNLYDALLERPYFKKYMTAESTSLEAEAAMFSRMFQEEFEDNEQLWKILEDRDIRWTDDLSYALGVAMREIAAFAAKGGRWTLPPLYADEKSDRTFVRKLVEMTSVKQADYTALIFESAIGWDKDRLFVTDLLLISMGLAEAEFIEGIPIRVTINEYVEISKYYSTPKSRSFVNGLLDKLIRRLADEGRITKPLV